MKLKQGTTGPLPSEVQENVRGTFSPKGPAGGVSTLVEKTLTLLRAPAFHHGLAAFFNLTAYDLRVAG